MSLKETLSFDESTGDVVAKRVVAVEDTVWELSDGDGGIVDEYWARVDKYWARVEDADEDVVVPGVTEI